MELKDGGVYEFTQSWLNTYQLCNETARAQAFDGLGPTESDATAVGTAVHEAIEVFILTDATFEEAVQAALKKLQTLVSLPYFQWTQTKNKTTLVKWVKACFASWHQHVLGHIGGLLPDTVERRMRYDLGDGVRLSGATDLACEGEDGRVEIWDWKTSGRPYEGWEKERWAIQPRAYSWLIRQLLGLDYYPKFKYAVMLRRTTPQAAQIMPIETHDGHIDWIREMCGDAVRLHQTLGQDGPWPRRDAGWHCSPKWCVKYDTCKGKHVSIGGS